MITFGYSSGRIEPFVGERLLSRPRQIALVNRLVGSDKAELYHEQMKQAVAIKLPDPERLAFSNYLLFSEPRDEALDIDNLLKSLHFYAQPCREPVPTSGPGIGVERSYVPVGEVAEPLVRT